MAVFIVIGLIFLIKLFLLQVVQDQYKLSADNNVFRYVIQYPPRGVIYDRNGNLMVYNEAAYDLLVIPRQVKTFDTLEFCRILNITPEDVTQRIRKARSYSQFKPSVFLEQLSKEEFAYLEEVLFKFPGFYVQLRSMRNYDSPIAAHALGYIGEVDNRDIERDTYYRQGDYIGRSGIEKAYEPILRGRKGIKIRLVDVHNREMGSYQDGKYDSTALPGKNIMISIDAELQAYAEQLMRNKRGSIIAIEPSSGELLVMVTAPAYDPNLLVGRARGRNFMALNQDPMKPLFNRAILGQYPPGSTFKVVNALIGLHEGVLHDYTRFGCRGVSTTPIPCSHNHHSPLDLMQAIEQSCNPYFWEVYKAILNQNKFTSMQDSYNYWREMILSFGIGTHLETDIPDIEDGNVPEDRYFDRYYGKKGWRPITIRSLSIGQGEIEMTPLQLANLAATIANRGYYYPPHFLKEIEGEGKPADRFDHKVHPNVSPAHFQMIVDAMGLVYQGGSGSARWYRIDGVECCGKTGTSQNPHGKNHSVFIAFAPKDNPRIAIAAVIENSGYGATWAAPIATLVMEKYLNGEVKLKMTEERMMNANLLDN
ncbi:MAG: penicillin-binding protein 2 [Bacteroidales bacterium]|nr:penicillin-binding protein 2 [Bacteroidales bacterium]